MLEHRDLTQQIVGLAIEVHRQAGPGLSESVYRHVAFELEQAGIPLMRQISITVFYKVVRIPMGFRADILVAETVILEIKAVAALLPAHEAGPAGTGLAPAPSKFTKGDLPSRPRDRQAAAARADDLDRLPVIAGTNKDYDGLS
jgi:GxxExxY protein